MNKKEFLEGINFFAGDGHLLHYVPPANARLNGTIEWVQTDWIYCAVESV